MEEKEFIKITNEDGTEVEVEILNYFTLESNQKDYLVYTEGKQDETGDIIVYTSEVVEKGEEIELKGIEDENVLKEITDVLTEIVQK
jgi:uncharacterized protein YrzB (UPF0473 family)